MTIRLFYIFLTMNTINNPLLAEMRAHINRMKIIAENSSDKTTASLAEQAMTVAVQLDQQMNKILKDEKQ